MSITQYGSRPLFTPDKIYLIGDVHNEADKLMSVLDQIEPLLTPNDHIVFCGDLVDRGQDATLTVATLVDLCKKYPTQIVFVEGNHDLMLREYLTTGSHNWMQYIRITLLDFQRKWDLPDIEPATVAQALLDHGYKEITSRTVPYYETAKVIATHAPLDKMTTMWKGGAKYQQDYADRANDPNFKHLLDRMRDELLWKFTDESVAVSWVDKFKVCGHQAGFHGTSPRLFKDRAFIDTACGLRPNGVLTCLVYPGKKYYQSK